MTFGNPFGPRVYGHCPGLPGTPCRGRPERTSWLPVPPDFADLYWRWDGDNGPVGEYRTSQGHIYAVGSTGIQRVWIDGGATLIFESEPEARPYQ